MIINIGEVVGSQAERVKCLASIPKIRIVDAFLQYNIRLDLRLSARYNVAMTLRSGKNGSLISLRKVLLRAIITVTHQSKKKVELTLI